MPELLLEPLKLELPPMWVEPVAPPAAPAAPVVEPVVVQAPKLPDLNAEAASLLEDAAKHLEAQGWVKNWGKRRKSTCLVGAMQDVLYAARGWDSHHLGPNSGFDADPVAKKAIGAMRFTSSTEAIHWNDDGHRVKAEVIASLRDGAEHLRSNGGIFDSANWTG